ncbi:MAG TPA: alpha/beta hydrolase, partial [Ilumatobacteraceae bacterium]|nr:alpha/beta hydrolase [Ilumatobacteraceae bacterium]
MNVLWSEEAGDGDRPLIALVHGSMDRSAGMLKLSRRLDSDFRVLRYDRRGYGRSFPHPGPFMMAGQIDDLVGLLAGRRAVLVGHSYGGDV